MNRGLIAKASISINTPTAKVWNALTNPEVIKQYMFGTNVISDWREGSPIVWKANCKERHARIKASFST
jgi:uncharacterized protein YndB with AHSA1/START domain